MYQVAKGESMKIISKFSDYYDSAALFGVDTTQVFVRKNEVFDSISAEKALSNIRNEFPFENRCRYIRGRKWYASRHLIGFCGRLYVGYKFEIDLPNHTGTHVDYAYSIEDIEKFLSVHDPDYLNGKWTVEKSAKALANAGKYSSNRHFTRQVISAAFEKFQGSNIDHGLFHEYQCPVFAISPHEWANRQFKGFSLYTNPVLKDFKFMKLIDPFTAHQEINQFIFGVLGTLEPDTVNIDDKHRVIGKGFDAKYGFRTRPSH